MKCSVFYILCTTLIIFTYYNILQNDFTHLHTSHCLSCIYWTFIQFDEVTNCYATYTSLYSYVKLCRRLTCQILSIIYTTFLIFSYHNLLLNDEVKTCYATYTFCIIFFETQLKFFYAIRTWQTSLVWKYNKMTLHKR